VNYHKACDSLRDKIERLHNVKQDVHQLQQTTETETSCEQLSASIVAPTERNSIFSDGEVATVHTIFADMVKNTKISQIEIEDFDLCVS
jgi:phosphoglycerate-specific signal transduction histidine kinase